MANKAYEITHAGRTSLQEKQLTKGTPENLELNKQRLRNDMLQMKKWLYALEHEKIAKQFHSNEKTLHDSIWAIDDFLVLKSRLIALDFQGFKPKK